MRENGLHARRPYVLITQRHRQIRLNWARVYSLDTAAQDCLYNVVMAGCACTVGEMSAMLTVVFLNEIVSGWVFCHGLGSHCP